ncbi:hypothetical protein K2173_003879 [Erythroxylum novogranatense]|uniref:Dof zinc finger protein n=1 Tax=Erythroxylum novogranatense TaxID=1862640 RepID=A0AAV8SJL0_9ROSI|nr:hypothetical protein K2173_003879 [Erythroxylum novogranatense]
MQDIHSIGGGGGGGGSLFGGGGGDRRLRQQHHQNNQALKCPRCDSLNTKFCYYNNYNLSQPRHFCKSCRRYWTKGGVLRNVPVGGGCRKTKRSKPKQQATSPSANKDDTPPPQNQPERERKSSADFHSSSESSSLTATNTAGPSANVEAASKRNGIGESKLFSEQNLNPSFDSGLLEHGSSDCGIFSEIGNLASLISTSSGNEQLQFGFSNILDQQWQHPRQEMGGGLIDHAVHLEFSRMGNGAFGAFDWQRGGDQGLLDLPNSVDQENWSTRNQWTDQDHASLYLPRNDIATSLDSLLCGYQPVIA